MASARMRNGRYTAQYRDPDGRQRSAGTYATKKEALRAGRLADPGDVSTEVMDAVARMIGAA